MNILARTAISEPKPEPERPSAGEVASEMAHWFLFSVVISLAYLPLALLGLYAFSKPIVWIAVLKSGGLLTYAATITSRTAGEYLRGEGRRPILISFCLFGLLATILPSIGVYGMLLASTIPQGASGSIGVPPDRIGWISLVVAIGAFIYSFGFTLQMKREGA